MTCAGVLRRAADELDEASPAIFRFGVRALVTLGVGGSTYVLSRSVAESATDLAALDLRGLVVVVTVPVRDCFVALFWGDD